MRTGSVFSRRPAPALAVAIFISAGLTPNHASADFFDFLRGRTPSIPARPSTSHLNAATDPASTTYSDNGHSTGYCVRKCDGRYFPVQARGSASAAQMCEAFCPAAPTQVYFGNSIDGAVSTAGEHYADSRNAFAYRKALKTDCTCNGREPAGLAPVDLSFDTTLQPGDVVATSDGLMAYSMERTGRNRTANFTPIASYPGLTPAIRVKLDAIKVVPDSTDETEETVRPSMDHTSAMTKRANLD